MSPLTHSPTGADLPGLRPRLSLLAGGCLALALLLSACGPSDGAGSAAAASGAQRPPAQVSVVPARVRDVPVSVEASGTAVPLNTVEIRPRLSSATVHEVLIRDGQEVPRGALLVRLDDRSERAALDKARAQLARDRVTLADLKRQLQRTRDLADQQFVTGSAVDTIQAQLDGQLAVIAADEAGVRDAEVALSQTVIRSPLAGRAGAVSVHPGAQVSASSPALVTISQMDPIGVTFTVPERELSGLLQARTAALKLTARLPGAGGRSGPAASGPSASGNGNGNGSERDGGATLDGELSFIDNAVDSTTGTVRLKGSFANPKRQLWPGQYVSVRLTLRTLRDAVEVPQAALVQRGSERSVYVVGPDLLAQPRVVQIRHGSGDWVAVDGIAAGERVIVEGKQNVRPGARVRLAAAAAAAGASGPAR